VEEKETKRPIDHVSRSSRISEVQEVVQRSITKRRGTGQNSFQGKDAIGVPQKKKIRVAKIATKIRVPEKGTEFWARRQDK